MASVRSWHPWGGSGAPLCCTVPVRIGFASESQPQLHSLVLSLAVPLGFYFILNLDLV